MKLNSKVTVVLASALALLIPLVWYWEFAVRIEYSRHHLGDPTWDAAVALLTYRGLLAPMAAACLIIVCRGKIRLLSVGSVLGILLGVDIFYDADNVTPEKFSVTPVLISCVLVEAIILISLVLTYFFRKKQKALSVELIYFAGISLAYLQFLPLTLSFSPTLDQFTSNLTRTLWSGIRCGTVLLSILVVYLCVISALRLTLLWRLLFALTSLLTALPILVIFLVESSLYDLGGMRYSSLGIVVQIVFCSIYIASILSLKMVSLEKRKGIDTQSSPSLVLSVAFFAIIVFVVALLLIFLSISIYFDSFIFGFLIETMVSPDNPYFLPLALMLIAILSYPQSRLFSHEVNVETDGNAPRPGSRFRSLLIVSLGNIKYLFFFTTSLFILTLAIYISEFQIF